MTHRELMTRAIELAKEAASEGEVPVGAVIARHGEIIAEGRNMREKGKNALYHAEIIAIDNACKTLDSWRLDDCVLYVTLEPCVMCAGAIGWAQIRRIVYGAADDKRGFTRFAPHAIHPKCTISTGILEEECKQLVQTFFRNKR